MKCLHKCEFTCIKEQCAYWKKCKDEIEKLEIKQEILNINDRLIKFQTLLSNVMEMIKKNNIKLNSLKREVKDGTTKRNKNKVASTDK